jgi:hypothetical protein
MDATSDAKVALEQAIIQCIRANMSDAEIKQYVRAYLTAIDH